MDRRCSCAGLPVGPAQGSPTDSDSGPLPGDILSLREVLDHQTGLARSAGVFTPQGTPSLTRHVSLWADSEVRPTVPQRAPSGPEPPAHIITHPRAHLLPAFSVLCPSPPPRSASWNRFPNKLLASNPSSLGVCVGGLKLRSAYKSVWRERKGSSLGFFWTDTSGRVGDRTGTRGPSHRTGKSQGWGECSRSPSYRFSNGIAPHGAPDTSERSSIKGCWLQPPRLWNRLQGHSLKLRDLPIESTQISSLV